MDRFRPRLAEVEAKQFTGTNGAAIAEWLRTEAGTLITPEGELTLLVYALEGVVRIVKDEWLVRADSGLFHVYAPHIFAETYESVT
jgi:hypothetical protein